MMAAPLSLFAVWALLLLPLVISPILGLLTPYATLLVIIPLFVVALVRRQFATAYSDHAARAFLAVFVVLALVFVVTADDVSDALRAFNFTMLLAYGAIAWFLAQRAGSAERVAQLAGLGVLLGGIEVAANAVLGAGAVGLRATGINIGPIVLSNALLALGFISLGGAMLRSDGRAWLYLLPPLLAIGATILTGSRGPLISVPFAILAAATWIWRTKFGGSLRAGMIGAVGLLVIAAAGLLVAAQTRAGSLLGIVEALRGGAAVTDESTRERLVLWQAGWSSFQQSPWLGHGWANIMSSVQPFLPADDAALATTLPQLHNDVLNFAVGAGIVGVACYFAIISAPLVGAWLSPRDRLRTFRLYGATVLTIVYIGGGLTDLMFGFEFHTFLFIMLTAILLGYCREQVPA
jgi:O-antigen ligase